jgi:hypothetical protein
MGVLRDGPGKAKEGTVSLLEKGRKEKKRIRRSFKKLQALVGSMGALGGPYQGP